MAVYTTIDDPSEYFQTAVFTGDGSTVVTVTNDGNSDLQPDLLWFKKRDSAVAHVLIDTNRGANVTSGFGPTGYNIVSNPNSNVAEIADGAGVMTITSDGFTSKELTSAAGNVSTASMCCWQWHCDAGDRITFTESGNNPGGVRQTNATAGLSIIVYTGTGADASCELAHGLGKAPEFIIFKRGNSTNGWVVYHKSVGIDKKLVLNDTAAEDADGAFMNGTIPNATNIFVGGTSTNTNADGGGYNCYAWTSVQGYSKFGKYVGNGNEDGPFVYTGFKPAFLMMKESSSAGGNWVIFDNKRDVDNVLIHRLHPNTTAGDNTSRNYIDFYSNGFKMRNTDADHNQTGETMVYMAIAESSFVTSTGTPTTAR